MIGLFPLEMDKNMAKIAVLRYSLRKLSAATDSVGDFVGRPFLGLLRRRSVSSVCDDVRLIVKL